MLEKYVTLKDLDKYTPNFSSIKSIILGIVKENLRKEQWHVLIERIDPDKPLLMQFKLSVDKKYNYSLSFSILTKDGDHAFISAIDLGWSEFNPEFSEDELIEMYQEKKDDYEYYEYMHDMGMRHDSDSEDKDWMDDL